MAKVRVACRQINGLTIRLSKAGYDDGTGDGVKPQVPDGPPVRLAGPSARFAGVNGANRLDLEPAITLVERDWIEAWLEQNKQNPFVTNGIVYVAGPLEEPAAERPL